MYIGQTEDHAHLLLGVIFQVPNYADCSDGQIPNQSHCQISNY